MNRDELDLLIKNGFLQSEPDETITQNELGSLVNQGFLEENDVSIGGVVLAIEKWIRCVKPFSGRAEA